MSRRCSIITAPTRLLTVKLFLSAFGTQPAQANTTHFVRSVTLERMFSSFAILSSSQKHWTTSKQRYYFGIVNITYEYLLLVI